MLNYQRVRMNYVCFVDFLLAVPGCSCDGATWLSLECRGEKDWNHQSCAVDQLHDMQKAVPVPSGLPAGEDSQADVDAELT